MNFRKLFLCALISVSGQALASDIDISLGGGSKQYETYNVRAALDVPKLPITLDLDYNHIRSERSEVLTETGVGFTWRPANWLSANYRYTEIREQVLEVTGNELGASVSLNPLWEGKLSTRLNFGVGDYDYEPRVSPAVAQLIASRVPRQRRYSLGFSQDLTEDFYVYGAYDEYRYTTDPAFVAVLLVRRFSRPTNAAATLTSFPKVGRTLGMGWYLTDKWLLDAAYADTDNVVAQAQDVKKLKLTHFWSKSLTLNLTLTRTDSAELRGLNGQQVSAPSASNIVELGMGYSF